MDDKQDTSPQGVDRWQLARDIGVLQVKLLVDGFRDLLLVPASLVVGIASFFSPVRPVGREFYDLLRHGRRSERYINLFGAVERFDAKHAGDDGMADPAAAGPEDIDRMVERVESFVINEYRHGHLTGPARERLDNAVRVLRQAARKPPGSGEEPPES